jgi:hypothetical protein
VDFSAFNLQEKRPQLVRRIKELQPEASQRAIGEAFGVDKRTVGRDLGGADAPAEPEPAETEVEELPAFLQESLKGKDGTACEGPTRIRGATRG